MPKAANLAGILIKLPPNQAKGGWDIDAEMLQSFARAFGLKWNVSFRWTSGRYTHGSAGVKRDINGVESHHITLSQVKTVEDARETMLHELCHCIQREKLGTHAEFMRQYRMYSGTSFSGRYHVNPFETEARDFAANNLAQWGEIIYS